jgi:hypothetical protein
MAPSDGGAQHVAAGTFFDDRGSLPRDAGQFANGQSDNTPPEMPRYGSTLQERSAQRALDPNGEVDTRQRPRKDRRPSDKQRICGKCQKPLMGQFVRALGDTYHLECFTCHVRILHSRYKYCP